MANSSNATAPSEAASSGYATCYASTLSSQADRQSTEAKPSSFPADEFLIKLSLSSIEGRPLSLSLARYNDIDHPIIGCSPGFLELSGLTDQDVLGQNCRQLNMGLKMPLRERLRHCLATGRPFLGVLANLRHIGAGRFIVFQNLLHLVFVVAGDIKYIIGLQADVTGLNLDLADGAQDALRLQKVVDQVVAARSDAWIHLQEGLFHTAPLYIYVCHSNGATRTNTEYDSEGGAWDDYDYEIHFDRLENAKILEGSMCRGVALAEPDKYLVLSPNPEPSTKWRYIVIGEPPAQASAEPEQQAKPQLSLTHWMQITSHLCPALSATSQSSSHAPNVSGNDSPPESDEPSEDQPDAAA